jgi:preprotein translocase subunit SecE
MMRSPNAGFVRWFSMFMRVVARIESPKQSQVIRYSAVLSVAIDARVISVATADLIYAGGA